MNRSVVSLLGFALGLGLPSGAWAEERKPVPLYTNEDLRRVAPFREQTGGSGPPAQRPAAAPDDGPRRRAEEYWRREAERLWERLQPLRDRAQELRLQIEERRARGGGRLRSDPQVAALQRRLQSLEERIREAEQRLEERARRAGALPGWLR